MASCWRITFRSDTPGILYVADSQERRRKAAIGDARAKVLEHWPSVGGLRCASARALDAERYLGDHAERSAVYA
jgi:hypothetical protein